MRTIVIATGGFDPVHSGHINYLLEAKRLGDLLCVGVNSDAWLIRKKGKYFLPWNERAAIVGHLKPVDRVMDFDDFDGSAIDAIRQVRGDRTSENIPEMSIQDPNLEFMFGVGGDYKQNSSSWILKAWSQITS
jgi:D-beta-D-heptose 7-phosphate kinase/D-beta-D-heptose 1-phosphate adenosyltransferase